MILNDGRTEFPVTIHRMADLILKINQTGFTLNRVDPFPPPFSFSRNSQSVAISACGNFGIIGATDGSVNKFNMQSGQARGTYVDPATGKQQAHLASVEGLAVDAFNRYLITASLDGLLKFWNFKDGTLLASLPLEAPATHLQIHRESNLVAVVCDDMVIRVYGVETQKLVRRLRGLTSLVTDVVRHRIKILS